VVSQQANEPTLEYDMGLAGTVILWLMIGLFIAWAVSIVAGTLTGGGSTTFLSTFIARVVPWVSDGRSRAIAIGAHALFVVAVGTALLGFPTVYARAVRVDAGGLTVKMFWGATRHADWPQVASIHIVPYRRAFRPLWGPYTCIRLSDGAAYRTIASPWFVDALEGCLAELGRGDLIGRE